KSEDENRSPDKESSSSEMNDAHANSGPSYEDNTVTEDERYNKILQVYIPVVNVNLDDKVVWNNKKGKEKNFSVHEVWKGIKQDSAK
nr:hypothetical protein [Tanacetum cinerariifolium]